MLIKNTCNFHQKKISNFNMCSDLLIHKAKCALEDGLKDSWEMFYEIYRKISIIEVEVFRVATF